MNKLKLKWIRFKVRFLSRQQRKLRKEIKEDNKKWKYFIDNFKVDFKEELELSKTNHTIEIHYLESYWNDFKLAFKEDIELDSWLYEEINHFLTDNDYEGISLIYQSEMSPIGYELRNWNYEYCSDCSKIVTINDNNECSICGDNLEY